MRDTGDIDRCLIDGLDLPFGRRYRYTAVARVSSFAREPDRFAGRLTAEEREPYLALRAPRARAAFLGARMLGKHCAALLLGESRGTGFDPGRVGIARGASGRPRVLVDGAAADGIDVALAHGGDYVLGAAAEPGGIGLDVERIDERLVRLKQSYVTPAEESILREHARRDRDLLLHLTRLWTAKESLVKYVDGYLFHVLHHCRLVAIDGDDFVLEYPAAGRPRQYRSPGLALDGHFFSCVEPLS